MKLGELTSKFAIAQIAYQVRDIVEDRYGLFHNWETEDLERAFLIRFNTIQTERNINSIHENR